MSRVSTAAAIEIQSCFRIALAKKAAKVLNSIHEEKCNFSATMIQSLVRLNIAKSRFDRIVSLVTRIQSLARVNIAKKRFERIVSLVTRIQSLVRANIEKSRFERTVSLAITIQCFFRVAIAKKRTEEFIQIHYNSNKKEQLYWARCCKLLVLVGAVMVVLCFFKENSFIHIVDNNKENENSISIITDQTKDENSVSPVESMKVALNVGVFSSGVGVMDDLSGITEITSKNNRSNTMYEVLSEEWRQQEIIQAEEENKMDILLQNVMRINEEMVEIEMPTKDGVVEASKEYNISLDIKEDFTGSQLILSRWNDISTRDETVSFASASGNSKDYLTVYPVITEEYAGENDESPDHLNIVQEFTKQFGMEHVLSVQNFDSVYI